MTETTPVRISCQAHDYIEIVCMRASRVLLQLYSGEQCQGIARDIIRVGEREHLQLETSSGVRSVNLAHIKTLEARGNAAPAHNFIVQLDAE